MFLDKIGLLTSACFAAIRSNATILPSFPTPLVLKRPNEKSRPMFVSLDRITTHRTANWLRKRMTSIRRVFEVSGGMRVSGFWLGSKSVCRLTETVTFRLIWNHLSLNLVILRTATVYGPYNLSGIVTPRITLGRVYKYLNEEMKYLYGFLAHLLPTCAPTDTLSFHRWSNDLRTNTVHLDDVAGSAWALAKWIEPLGRAKADEIAGETLRFHAPDKKDLVKDLEGHLPKDKDPVAPLFNVVSIRILPTCCERNAEDLLPA